VLESDELTATTGVKGKALLQSGHLLKPEVEVEDITENRE
jgi:hypothetical protein